MLAFSLNAIGKNRVKKTFQLRGRFCFHILKNMEQNIKRPMNFRTTKGSSIIGDTSLGRSRFVDSQRLQNDFQLETYVIVIRFNPSIRLRYRNKSESKWIFQNLVVKYEKTTICAICLKPDWSIFKKLQVKLHSIKYFIDTCFHFSN